MMRMLVVILCAVAVLPLRALKVQAHEGHEHSEAPATLTTGRYTAKVKALVCGACAKKITATARAFPGLQNVSVDAKSSTLRFAVEPDARVDIAKLQAAMKAASDEMGMGADYSLSDIRKASGKKVKSGAQR